MCFCFTPDKGLPCFFKRDFNVSILVRNLYNLTSNTVTNIYFLDDIARIQIFSTKYNSSTKWFKVNEDCIFDNGNHRPFNQISVCWRVWAIGKKRRHWRVFFLFRFFFVLLFFCCYFYFFLFPACNVSVFFTGRLFYYFSHNVYFQRRFNSATRLESYKVIKSKVYKVNDSLLCNFINFTNFMTCVPTAR